MIACVCCKEMSPLGYDVCDTCNEAIVTEWPIALGVAFQRFLLHAEVEGLVVAVHEHVYRYAVALCNDDGQRAVEMADALGAALERLATLALKAS